MIDFNNGFTHSITGIIGLVVGALTKEKLVEVASKIGFKNGSVDKLYTKMRTAVSEELKLITPVILSQTEILKTIANTNQEISKNTAILVDRGLRA